MSDILTYVTSGPSLHLHKPRFLQLSNGNNYPDCLSLDDDPGQLAVSAVLRPPPASLPATDRCRASDRHPLQAFLARRLELQPFRSFQETYLNASEREGRY